MAIRIKSIPELTGDVAEAFDKKAKANLSKKSSFRFADQALLLAKILAKAKI